MSFKLPQASPQPLDKGFFATDTVLSTKYPVGKNGWYAIVGTTDSIWVWDADTSAWKDSKITLPSGATGSFTTVDLKTVTVTNGVIVTIA